MDSWTELTKDQNPEKYARLFRSLGLALIFALKHKNLYLNTDFVSSNTDGCVFQSSSKRLHLGDGCHVLSVHSLRGEVLKPATELAMKKSAICLRASRPVGLFPFRCCSLIKLSSSSLKA